LASALAALPYSRQAESTEQTVEADAGPKHAIHPSQATEAAPTKMAHATISRAVKIWRAGFTSTWTSSGGRA